MEIFFDCANCGSELEADFAFRTSRVRIEPCETCIAAAITEAAEISEMEEQDK